MRNPLTPKGENTRQQILDAAYWLFLENGYHAASTREIARQSGLTLGGLYAHFAGKEEIFTAVFEAYHPFEKVFPAIRDAQGDTTDDLLRDCARRMVAALGSQREALNLIFIEIVEFHGVHFSSLVPKYFPVLFDMVARIQNAQPRLRPVPPEILARSFFGLFFSFYMTQMVTPIFQSDEKTLDTFVDLYLYGVVEREPGQSGPHKSAR